jgi:hypothetical protein
MGAIISIYRLLQRVFSVHINGLVFSENHIFLYSSNSTKELLFAVGVFSLRCNNFMKIYGDFSSKKKR